MIKSKNLWGLVLLLIILGSSFYRLLQPELFRTHDIEYHAARLANYYLAISQGQLPPRWAPNLNFGFGYPTFSLIYPLPYFIGTIFFSLTKSLTLSINLYIFLSVIAAAVGSYLLALHLTKKWWLAVSASLLYVAAPYFLLNIYVRGAIAETGFLGILPWIFYTIYRWHKLRNHWWGRLLAIILASLLILSHQVSLVVVGPLLLIWAISYFYQKSASWTFLRSHSFIHLALIGLASLLMTSFFWLPLIFEKNLTAVANHQSFSNFSAYFSSIPRLFWSKWEYGGFTPGVVDEKFSTMIGVGQLLVLLISLLFIIPSLKLIKKKFFSTRKHKYWIYWWSSIAVFSIFLITRYSTFIWQIIKPLQLLQFPYRLLWVVVLSCYFLFIFLIPQLKKNAQIFVVITISIMSIFQLTQWGRPIGTFYHNNYYWFEYFNTADAYQEFRPMWFDTEKNIKVQEKIAFIDEQAFMQSDAATFSAELLTEVQIEDLQWNGTKMRYNVDVPNDGFLLHKTSYFPGWEATVDNQPSEIKYENELFPGRIIIPVTEGRHTITTSFTQNTPSRKVSLIMSIAGLLFSSLLTIRSGIKLS